MPSVVLSFVLKGIYGFLSGQILRTRKVIANWLVRAMPLHVPSTAELDIQTLLDRLTAARASNLDNIDNAKLLTIPQAWEMQPLVEDERAPPVQNTWYTIASGALAGFLLGCVQLEQINDESDVKTIEVELVVDGRTWTNSVPAVSGSPYFVDVEPISDKMNFTPDRHFGGVLSAEAYDTAAGAPIEHGQLLPCHSFSLRYRLTDAPGTNETLTCDFSYFKLKAV